MAWAWISCRVRIWAGACDCQDNLLAVRRVGRILLHKNWDVRLHFTRLDVLLFRI